MLNAQSKIAVFIDGANLYATVKALGYDIDYKKLLKELQGRGNLLRAFYYTAIFEEQEYSSIRPLVDWLDYNGYTAVTKVSKEYMDASGRRKVKSDMDIELAVDAMEIAAYVDEIILFSGDGNFRSLVEALQRRGVRVTVASTISCSAADDRRRSAPPGRSLYRSLGIARQHRPRSVRAAGDAGTAHTGLAGNALRLGEALRRPRIQAAGHRRLVAAALGRDVQADDVGIGDEAGNSSEGSKNSFGSACTA